VGTEWGDRFAIRSIYPQPRTTMTIPRSADLLTIYPATELSAYMEQQSDLFDRAKPQLIRTYLGQYVWFENGEVLDADLNHEALVLRIYAAEAPRPLFIRKVVTVEPKLLVRSIPNLK
jgi:hypothetical protein